MIYDFTDAAYVDTSAALAIEELIRIAVEETQGCFVCGLSGEAAHTLTALGVPRTAAERPHYDDADAGNRRRGAIGRRLSYCSRESRAI